MAGRPSEECGMKVGRADLPHLIMPANISECAGSRAVPHAIQCKSGRKPGRPSPWIPDLGRIPQIRERRGAYPLMVLDRPEDAPGPGRPTRQIIRWIINWAHVGERAPHMPKQI